MNRADTTSIQPAAQAKVQTLLDDLTRRDRETGMQVAAYLGGKLVIDAWSGVANPQAHQPVAADTLFLAFSCAKGITATVIHQLVEAGKLDYDTPVAHYWPAFAANGKETVTVRHVLAHQEGIPQMPRRITIEELCDWDAMVHMVEGLKPIWRPGTKTGYHGFTYGVILGELAQRVDPRPFARIVQDDICRPLGIDDLTLGVSDAVASRVALIGGQRAPFLLLPPCFLVKQSIPSGVEPGPKWNSPAIRHAVLPAGNLFTTARSLARHYAALIGDGVDGVRLLPPERVRIATALATDGPDQIFFGARIPKALGYWLGGDENGSDNAFGTRCNTFGHTGSGSMIGFADPEYQFAFALVKNRMTWRFGKDTDTIVAQAVRAALGIPH
ncbi:MAG TPA: serine hydrolase domain-containing protein [Ktedonobacterales bacterium]